VAHLEEANLMKFLTFLPLLVFSVALAGCPKPDNNDEHFASTQQRALEKAKNVDKMLQDVEQKRRQQMEEIEN
jgi:hypothetical protein